MKKLYLIGDSIRMQYCAYVKAALAGKAEVVWHDNNARFAAYTLMSIGNWEAELRVGRDVDCVHWNTGLHDCIRACGEDPQTPVDIYAYYIERICKRLQNYYPSAKMVFATSTPVQEEKFDFWFARRNADIDELNAAATGIVKKYGMAVNDLNTLLKAQDPDAVHSDKTHFNVPLGREIITKAVLKSVCPILDVDYNSLTMPDFNVEMSPEKDILK